MISSTKDCLNCIQVNDFRKQACVYCLTAGVISSLAVDWLTVDHLHVLVEGVVHEGNTILFVDVIIRDLFAFLPKPFNCISSYTIIATHSQTIISPRPKHINPECDI